MSMDEREIFKKREGRVKKIEREKKKGIEKGEDKKRRRKQI